MKGAERGGWGLRSEDLFAGQRRRGVVSRGLAPGASGRGLIDGAVAAGLA